MLKTKSRGVEKIVKRKPKVIEGHYDDCGESLKGLDDNFACHCCDEYSSSSDEDECVPILSGEASGNLPTYWFEPMLADGDDLQVRASSHCMIFNKMLAITAYLSASGEGGTICESAGGTARTTRVLIRFNDQRVKTGPNFDLVVDAGLLDPK